MIRARLLALFVCLCTSWPPPAAFAQERDPSTRVSWGAFWSANIATVAQQTTAGDVSARQWVGGGVSLGVPLGAGMSLDARAFWNRRGARLAIAGSAGGYQDVFADYVSVPALLKVSRRGAVRPYLLAGAEVGIRTRARVHTVFGALDADEDASALIRRTDAVLDVGAGLERTLSRSTVFVEALYGYGLTDVTPGESGEATRTRTVTLSAGLRF